MPNPDLAMSELSLQNIEQVRHDISLQEIIYSRLLDEFVDHVCCDIENEMFAGLTFSEAYEKVKLRIGNDRFREIQKETLYAVDFKYRNMRNTMKISGIAGTILLSFAALFKIQHWPLAGIMMTLGALLLAFVFLPSSLGVLWKETRNKRRLFLFVSAFLTGTFFIAGTLFKVQHWPAAGIILSASFVSAVFMFFPAIISMIFRDEENRRLRAVAVTGAVGAVFYIAGMLFKIQHWPLATILMFLGIIFLAFVALPWYTRLNWKNESAVNPEFIFLLVACLSIIVPGALINLNLQFVYKQGYYSNYERQDAFSDYLSENNSKLIGNVSDTSAMKRVSTIHANTVLLLDHIDQIRKKIYDQAGNQQGYSQELFPGTPSRTEIDKLIHEYMTFMSENLPGQYINMIDPARVLPAADGKVMSLLSGMNSLGLLKSSILTCENAALRSLQNENNNLSAIK